MSTRRPQKCPLCSDTGWVLDPAGGNRYVRCNCMQSGEREVERLMERSNIPSYFAEHYVFRLWKASDSALIERAYTEAMNYFLEYPDFGATKSTGLLFQGTFGTGKSHLGVGILNELIHEKRVSCRFHDFSDLLNMIRNSYDPDADVRTSEVFQPVFDAEVLLVDDVGAERLTGFVTDVLGQIINHRYMTRKPLLITTNYLDDVETLVRSGLIDPKNTALVRRVEAHIKAQGGTLAQRIGPRLRSRLHELCRPLLLVGEDWRELQA